MTTRDIEQRTTKQTVEVRGSPGSKKIGGYAATFNSKSKLLPGGGADGGNAIGGPFIEQIAPGFFNKSKNDGWPDVVASFNHRDDMLLGAVRSGTLRLNVDQTGLDYEIDIPNVVLT